MKQYTLTCSESQLRLIAKCVEDCSRFVAGQCGMWHTTSVLDNHSSIAEKLDELQPMVTPDLPQGASYSWNGSHCPNDAQRQLIAQTYPIYREILHFFAVQNGVENAYTSPTLTCAEGGEPVKIECMGKYEKLLHTVKADLDALATAVNNQLFDNCREWYWMGDRAGDICCFDDTDFLGVEDMILILEKNITYEQYSEWHYAELDHPEQHINLRSWLMGARHS